MLPWWAGKKFLLVILLPILQHFIYCSYYLQALQSRQVGKHSFSENGNIIVDQTPVKSIGQNSITTISCTFEI